MKKIIVTGGLGFIGSNLIELLIKKNFKVLNIDKVTYSSNFYNNKEFVSTKNYRFIKCDIKDKRIKKILFEKKIFINDVAFSPFHIKSKLKIYKKNSKYRKPGNLMIESLFKRWDIIRSKSIMIGDQKKDELASKKSNIKFQYAENNFYNQVKKLIN